MADSSTVPLAVLLVVHPARDLVATLIDLRRKGSVGAGDLQRVSLVLDAAAAIAIVALLLATFGASVVVFGI